MLCFKKKKRRFFNSFSLVLKPISSSSPLSRPHNESSAAYHQKRATREKTSYCTEIIDNLVVFYVLTERNFVKRQVSRYRAFF